MNELLKRLRTELTRPRELRVFDAEEISVRLEVNDALDGLTPERVMELDETDQELLMSPLFTPGRGTRERVEPAIPLTGVSEDDLARIVDELAGDWLHCPVSFGGRSVAAAVPPVVIERFLRLLHLGHAIHPEVMEALAGIGLNEQQSAAVRALARDVLWRDEEQRGLLITCLGAMAKRDSFDVEKLHFLEELADAGRPDDATDLVQHLENLVESYNTDAEHPVFNEHLAKEQSGSIRSRLCGPDVKKRRLALAQGLLEDLRGYLWAS